MSTTDGVPDEVVAPEVAEVGDVVLRPPTVYAPLEVRAVEMVLPAANPVLVLVEQSAPYRTLRIPVGMAEGNAIAFALRGIETPRPLTHTLVIELLERFSLTLEAVRIPARDGATYLAELLVSGPSGLETLACRPSDGVALALRQRLPAPITASLALLEEAGLVPDGS